MFKFTLTAHTPAVIAATGNRVTTTTDESDNRIGVEFVDGPRITVFVNDLVGVPTECDTHMFAGERYAFVNGHSHFVNGSCDLEPSYAMGGPA
jgi:hypothetical protein